MNTIYTAIFGPYDDLKEPKVITPGWRYVVFTDQDLKSNVWEVRKSLQLERGAQRTARLAKILNFQAFGEVPTIWVDASFIINCDLTRWMRRMNGPLTVIRHPVRDCVYEEALECINQKRGNVDEIIKQHAAYLSDGMPKHKGLISTGIIMRNNVPSVRQFCTAWYEELQTHSSRDQLSFAHTAWKRPGVHSEIKWDYRTATEFLHVPHLNNPARVHRLKALGINQ